MSTLSRWWEWAALGHPGPHPKLRGGGLLSIELANLSLREEMEILRVQFISHQPELLSLALLL